MRKITSLFLSIMLLLGIAAPYAQAASFKDTPESYRFYEEIDYLSDLEIISGFPDGSFKPDKNVTRAEAAIMIGRMKSLDGTKRATKFTDVGKQTAASGYIQSAVDAGIIQGFPDGTFRPNNPVTRGDLAIFLSRAFGLEETSEVRFKDVSKSSKAYAHIGKLVAAKITAGYPDNTYRPNQAVTRGQYSAFVARGLNPYFIEDYIGNELLVSFLNVGQGDAILLEMPNGKTMLVDAARSDTAIQSALAEAGVDKIDVFVATHPDADHIGGADHVIDHYGVSTVIDSGQEHTSQTYFDYLESVDASGAAFKTAAAGQNISPDTNVTVKVLYTDDNASNLNDGSIVLMVSYGDIDYLLTGDASKEIEAQLISKYDLEAEVLKVGHHGSATSTSQAFLNEVDPLVAVLSYGEDNSYGHPDSAVYNRLVNSGAEVLATVDGTVYTSTDGKDLFIGDQVKEPDEEETIQPANVSIVKKDLQGETVTIQNKGNTNADLTGWKLVSVQGNQEYTFPAGFVLGAGKTVTITSGSNAKHQPPAYLKWNNTNIWVNSGDAAELYNANGVKVSTMP